MIGGKKWQKGESGNPKGRQKGKVSFKRILEEKLAEVWQRDYLKRTAAEMIADQLLYSAIVKKSRHAIEAIMDRTDGKPIQAVTLDANLNVSREQRLANIEDLLSTLPKPDADGPSNPRIN